jgi:hypothetical protein
VAFEPNNPPIDAAPLKIVTSFHPSATSAEYFPTNLKNI